MRKPRLPFGREDVLTILENKKALFAWYLPTHIVPLTVASAGLVAEAALLARLTRRMPAWLGVATIMASTAVTIELLRKQFSRPRLSDAQMRSIAPQLFAELDPKTRDRLEGIMSGASAPQNNTQKPSQPLADI